jgi:hypothetical protein
MSSVENRERHAEPMKNDDVARRVEQVGAQFVVSKVEPSAPKMSRHYPGVTSKVVKVEPIENRSRGNKVARKVEPSAPALPEILSPKEFVSDFPGVKLPPSVEKAYIHHVSPSAPSSGEYPRALIVKENRKNQNSSGHHHLDEDDLAITGNKSKSHYSHELRSPLGRSSLENTNFNRSTEKKHHETHSKYDDHCIDASKYDDHCIDAYHDRQHHTMTSNYCKKENSLSYARNPQQTTHGEHVGNDREKILEIKLKEALEEKQALERICAQLEKENAELKQVAREAGRKVRQTQWTEQDEEEFLASRKLRLEAQNLIKAPVQEHLEKVNYIYEIKNQWCMTNKSHFSLQFPNQFQRAPELDLRDKRKEEEEALKEIEEPNSTIPELHIEDHRDTVKGTRLSYGVSKPRASLVSVSKHRTSIASVQPRPRTSLATAQKPVVEPPSGLAALKKLISNR